METPCERCEHHPQWVVVTVCAGRTGEVRAYPTQEDALSDARVYFDDNLWTKMAGPLALGASVTLDDCTGESFTLIVFHVPSGSGAIPLPKVQL
jgi:hypothetical protein